MLHSQSTALGVLSTAGETFSSSLLDVLWKCYLCVHSDAHAVDTARRDDRMSL